LVPGRQRVVTDISAAGYRFRGTPVTLISEGVEALLRRCGAPVTGLDLILRTARDIDGSDCIFQSSAVLGVTVWIELFGCTFEDGHHEDGEWSVFLPRER